MSAIAYPVASLTTDVNSAGIPLGIGNTYPMLGEGNALSPPYNGLGPLNPPTAVPWQDNPNFKGADMMITDVVSFEVKIATPETIARAQSDPRVDAFVDLLDSYALYLNTGPPPASPLIQPLAVLTSNNPVFQAAGGPAVFDTWSSVQDDTYNYSTW